MFRYIPEVWKHSRTANLYNKFWIYMQVDLMLKRDACSSSKADLR